MALNIIRFDFIFTHQLTLEGDLKIELEFPATIDGAGTEIYWGNFIFDYKLYKEYNSNSLYLTNQFIYLE